MFTQLASVLVGVLVVGVTSLASPGYHIASEIAIGGEGGWDYVIADATMHRVYVSHATRIVVADTETGAVVGEIADTPGVHGFAIAREFGRGFTSNGRANSSTIVDEFARPLLVKPRPSSRAMAKPCTPGVSAISPTMAPVSVSATTILVAWDT